MAKHLKLIKMNHRRDKITEVVLNVLTNWPDCIDDFHIDIAKEIADELLADEPARQVGEEIIISCKVSDITNCPKFEWTDGKEHEDGYPKESKQDKEHSEKLKQCKSKLGDYKCHVPTNVKDSKGRIVHVDKCLKGAIENLNAHGIKTIASCCGHGVVQPSILVELSKQYPKGAKEWLKDRHIYNEDIPDLTVNFLVELLEQYHKSRIRGEERSFTEHEIELLQSEVHKITGDGEVMQCFNKLLGINAG